jgi:hypothetical protein
MARKPLQGVATHGEFQDNADDNFIDLYGMVEPMKVEVGNLAPLLSTAIPTEAINNVPITGLQALLDSLPRVLTKNYVISTLPGEVNTLLRLRDLSGSGSLLIKGALNAGETTHSVLQLDIRSCNVAGGIRVNGIAETQIASGPIYIEDCSCKIHLYRCTALGSSSSTGRGISALNSNFVYAQECTISNRSAAFRSSMSLVWVDTAYGENNIAFISAPNGGRIQVRNEGTIKYTSYSETPSESGDPRDSAGRPFFSNVGKRAAETYTVELSELRIFLRQRLSRFLPGDVTVNVNGGEPVNDVIDVIGFYGPGALSITATGTLAMDSAVNRSVMRFNIRDCTIPTIDIAGFNCNVTNNDSVYVYESSSYVRLRFISATAGVSTTTANRGVRAVRSQVEVRTCEFSNKNRVIETGIHGYISSAVALTGTENAALFHTGADSEIVMEAPLTSYTIGYTTLYTRTGGGGRLIGSAGERISFLPMTDNATDLGAATQRFKDLYLTNPTIITSDEREKTDVQRLPINITDFIMSLDPVSYKMAEGTSGRRHWGLVAQDVEKAMTDNGITDMDFAGLIKSPVYEEVETGEYTEEVTGYEEVQVGEREEEVETGEYDGEGNPVYETVKVPVYGERPVVERIPVTEKRLVDTRYGLRYEEMLAAVVKMVQELKREIALLKGKKSTF